MAAFTKLHSLNGHGFQGLNEALLIFVPDRPDASTPKDYGPIGLTHLFAKLVAKTLAASLSPRLASWVKENQCAFLKNHCIHDNFMLVQRTTCYLHWLKEPRVVLQLDQTHVRLHILGTAL